MAKLSELVLNPLTRQPVTPPNTVTFPKPGPNTEIVYDSRVPVPTGGRYPRGTFYNPYLVKVIAWKPPLLTFVFFDLVNNVDAASPAQHIDLSQTDLAWAAAPSTLQGWSAAANYAVLFITDAGVSQFTALAASRGAGKWPASASTGDPQHESPVQFDSEVLRGLAPLPIGEAGTPETAHPSRARVSARSSTAKPILFIDGDAQGFTLEMLRVYDIVKNSNELTVIHGCTEDHLLRGLLEAFHRHGPIERLDLFTHGAPGSVSLNGVPLFAISASGDLVGRATAEHIAPLLAADATVRLLGCRTAVGDSGRKLMGELQRAFKAQRSVWGTLAATHHWHFNARGFDESWSTQFLSGVA